MDKEKAEKWAKDTFGKAKLGDKRRTKRAVEVSSLLVQHPGLSIPKMAKGKDSIEEKMYRHARSEHVDPTALLEAGQAASAARVVAQCKECPRDILIIQDTTNLDYAHQSVRDDLGPINTSAEGGRRGWLVHEALAVEAETGRVLDLVHQTYWSRDPKTHGKSKDRRERPYEEKESFKWQMALEAIEKTLYEIKAHLIIVSDRESDVFEYLMVLLGQDWRFVIRSSWDRNLVDTTERVESYRSRAQFKGYAALQIDQKGGRKSRTARVEVRAGQITLKPPKAVDKSLPALTVNVLYIHEPIPPDGEEAVNGIILTNEPIETTSDLDKIMRYYGLRWVIEDYNKCWKSEGLKVEALRNQMPDNLLRIAIPMAFATVYVMQLREALVGAKPNKLKMIKEPNEEDEQIGRAHKEDAQRPCTDVLSDEQWQVLWVQEEKKKLPKKVPTKAWAGLAIARLGGFMDSKRTGRPGYKTMWNGWLKLMDLCESVRLVFLLLTPHSSDSFVDV